MEEKIFVNKGFAIESKDYEIEGKETKKEFQQVSNIYKCMDTEDFESIALGWYDSFTNDRFKKFNIIATVDDVGYTEKLKDQEEIKKLNNRIGVQAKCIDFSEFADMIGNKRTFILPSHI